VDFGAVAAFKLPLLARAHARFEEQAAPAQREDLAAFAAAHSAWLPDYALFMAIKDAVGGSWADWPRALAMREPDALENARREHARAVRLHEFVQYLFFRQWADLRRYAHERHVRIMGDAPIFVAHDSADVWAHPELFQLAADGRPAFVAGVPPDYFSATGQLWGNPLYRWDAMARTGYRWWIDRLSCLLGLVDLVRLDHFRGFEAYWEVPATEKTAVVGRWVKGPGAAFFEALLGALGELPIVAENLGVITPEVEALRERFGFPGMAVLQFAFAGDDSAHDFLPYNYSRRCVAYTGTHDNDTTVGWLRSRGGEDSTRTARQVEKEREFCLRYLGTDGRQIHWDFIRAVFSSVATTVIVPLQDVLGLGSEARMNRPGRAEGNWRWRYRRSDFGPADRKRLREMTEDYGRARPASGTGASAPPAGGARA
jgi:4-alpha-glucanotransferase